MGLKKLRATAISLPYLVHSLSCITIHAWSGMAASQTSESHTVQIAASGRGGWGKVQSGLPGARSVGGQVRTAQAVRSYIDYRGQQRVELDVEHLRVFTVFTIVFGTYQ